jgi:hypothetical protein
VAAYGRYNPYPKRYGGGPNVLEIEHMALLDALAPGWDVGEDTAIFAETYAHALVLTCIWALNKRLEGSRVPARMLETLRTWEAACGLRPLHTATPLDRRRAVAAKLRGSAGNALAQIDDVCRELAGDAYLGLVTAQSAQVVTYWPGMNPGPPGFEWTSNLAQVGVRLDGGAFRREAELLEVVQRLRTTLMALCPAWMGFEIGTDDGGFIVSVGIVGQTLLGG